MKQYKSPEDKHINRPQGRDQVTLTCDAELIDKINRMAIQGHRSRNMQMVMLLEKAIAADSQQSPPPNGLRGAQ